ncbi:MAG: hypothetical protein ACE37B_22995 [Ilumatobacter sp.]|uniref:hypothetical protein n=1 Tax=Ilumatobacter sp. TaxID=1967498 RepID=UPI0039193DD5
MGVWANKQEDAHRKIYEAVEDASPANETLIGAVHASMQSAFSVKFLGVGVTEHHLIILPLNKRWKPTDEPALLLRPDDLEIDTLFDRKPGVAGFLALNAEERGTQLRFSARGKKYKLEVMGGTLVQDALTSSGQKDGLAALYEFLDAARS